VLFDALANAALPPYITFYPAVVIVSLCAGPRAGLGAALLTLMTAWYFWVPTYSSFAIDTSVSGLTVATYAVTSAILAIIVGVARLALDYAAESEAERGVAARESVHRIKNLLAVIQSLSRKIASNATDVKSYRDHLDMRLRSLAIAQDVLVKRDWADVALTDLIQATLGPFLPNPRLQVRLNADALVPCGTVASLSMALYELATNSMKYGALANPDGLVRLESREHEDDVLLEWREIGLVHVAIGEGAGLGSALIRAALSAIEGSSVLYDIGPESVSCVFEWPAQPSPKSGASPTAPSDGPRGP
jgi:two-component sensor histidine kinase